MHRVLKLYIIFGFCVVCIRSISITSLERLVCESDKYNPIRGCIGTFILPNVVLTTSNCAEKCLSVGKLPIVRTFIHRHYKNYVRNTRIMVRNDIAIVVTQEDTKKRKLMKLSALDNLSTIGLKALVPIMDEDKPRLAVAIVERCYIEQPFGYYVCASNRVTPKTVKVCQERQEEGVPLLIEDRIFGIMGLTDKDKCKLPQRSFTALGPALYWISDTVRNLGYDEAVITTLHDMTSTKHPRPSKTSPQPTTTRQFITTITPIPTTTTPPIRTTIPPIRTTIPPITTSIPPISTLEEHYNTYPAETPATLSTRLYITTYPTVTSPKHHNPSDLHSDDPLPKPLNISNLDQDDHHTHSKYPPPKPLNFLNIDQDAHHTHPTYSPPSNDRLKLTFTPSTFDFTADSFLTDSSPKFFKRYTAFDIPPTFPKGFTIDPSLIMNLRESRISPYLAHQGPTRINHSYASDTAPKGSYPSISNDFGSKALRLLPEDLKEKRPNERKKKAIDYFLKAHKSLKSFNIANATNDFIIQDISPVALPLTLSKAAPIMRTQKVLSTKKPLTKKRITAITFVPLATSSRTKPKTLSKPQQSTKLTTKRTTVTIPFVKALENNKTTNIMDWFNVIVKDKLKNQTSAVFYIATTTTTEAYSPLSSQRPLNFIDLT